MGVVGVLDELDEEPILVLLRELARERGEAFCRVVPRLSVQVVANSIWGLARDDFTRVHLRTPNLQPPHSDAVRDRTTAPSRSRASTAAARKAAAAARA